MNVAAGLFIGFLLIIGITILVVAPIELTTFQWRIMGAMLAVLFWGSIKMTFGFDIHHFLANVLVVLGTLIAKIIKAISKAIRKRKAQEKQIVREPVRMATKNSEIHVVHPTISAKPTTVILGYNKKKRPIQIDLADQHTILGASSGGGKTNALLGILIQLMLKKTRIIIHIIDLKSDRMDGLYKFASVANYVSDEQKALYLLRDLMNEATRRFQTGDIEVPIVLIVDEIADMTSSVMEKDYKRAANVLFTKLARKARSANINIIVATQHAKFNVLTKEITHNLMRKIVLPVAASSQAEVVLEFKPKGPLPVEPGEFLLKEKLKLRRGRTLPVSLHEIDAVINGLIEEVDDKRVRLWQAISNGRKIGDNVDGINKTYRDHKEDAWCEQNLVKYGYRHLVHAGVLNPPNARGGRYSVRMTFVEGLSAIQRYIAEGKWEGAPAPFIIHS